MSPLAFESIAVVETASIHEGVALIDGMTKAGRVEIVTASPIPPGRFLVVLGGAVGDVDAAHRRGLELAPQPHDRVFLAEAHPDVLRAVARLAASFQASRAELDASVSDALGLFEISTVSAALDAADRGCKATSARLLHLHLARGITGRAFGVFAGRQDAVEASLTEAEGRAREHDAWIGATLLPRPDAAVARWLAAGRWGDLAGQEIL